LTERLGLMPPISLRRRIPYSRARWASRGLETPDKPRLAGKLSRWPVAGYLTRRLTGFTVVETRAAIALGTAPTGAAEGSTGGAEICVRWFRFTELLPGQTPWTPVG